MYKIKTHKTVEQIAKKHGTDVSYIKNQLKMGISVEHEHTKDKDLATDIALQHLDEIPDYYTKLKKLEKDSKRYYKESKENEVEELESRLKKLSNVSYDSIDNLMRKIMKKHGITAKELHNSFVKKHNKTPDEWIKEKLNEGTLHHWFKGSRSKDGKPGWVQSDGSPCANEPGETKTPKCFSSGRLRALKRKGKKGLKLIRSAVRRKREKDKNQQSKTGGASPTYVSTFVKGKKNKNYVKSEPGIKESMELNEVQKDKPGKGSGKKDACYYKVKSRYSVFPSAYASGALVKCRNVGAKNWGTKSESCWDGYKKRGMKKKGNRLVPNRVPVKEDTMIRYCPKCNKNESRSECKYGPKFWDMYSMPITLKKYTPNTPHPGNFPESYDHEHSMARSELSTIVSAAKRLRKKMKGEGNIEAWVQSKITKAADYLDSAADYIDSGEMKKQVKPVQGPYDEFDRLVNVANTPSLSNYTKIKLLKSAAKIHPSKNSNIDEQISNVIEYSNWREDFGLSEDWQKINRKDKTDGLSQKAVDAYRRENPGSELQTAVTEKNPKGKRKERRKRFCSRMKGAKEKLTSAKTARDPDSRINKALRSLEL